ncbi:hypothetical protein St703_17770 [Sporolactobacillus terrae]|uniref:Uncharacterized protein n=1 Tax=Sporolactobacillus terrae TaxID=269673 RepID=A0A5K7WXQ7_9BACL|nr:hypothetical protein St703_17770 [Sporolactobacillus terrae]
MSRSQIDYGTLFKKRPFQDKREDARLLRSVPVDRKPKETPQDLQDQPRRLLDRPRSRSVDASNPFNTLLGQLKKTASEETVHKYAVHACVI